MIKIISVIMGCICASFTSFAFIPTKAEMLYGVDFQGGSYRETEERKIYYSERVVDKYENPYRAPTFGAGKVNGCAVDAGGNAFIYYDRLYDDLVPDYKHKYVFGKFNYGTHNNGITNMFNDLYARMDTVEQGTSVDGFLKGMRSYADSRGHSITLEKVTGSFYNTNYTYIQEQLKQEKVAAIFMSGFSISSVGGPSKRDGYDYVLENIYSGHHVMLVYGYDDYYYYDSNGKLIERDTYFYASTGYVGLDRALPNIGMYGNVDDIYLIDIK